ncbi:signal peptidase II [Staphylococcus sp. EG-SA-6]|jgi:signal peptidase II|uniref:Lipoprotein signal peptidase n=6 Tax=Bacillales TaxID=1385 RepID=LSPA_STAHJ|nr:MULTISPECIES: signal peptidase II [Staphylococcus]Q4L5P8.1 RecName: Full=Lipoprotein signal peptidase; AltName: Full=Prolipoprotein signal peptidase; AltName: Full=Signal peptidase II; Short=SPase II [Staphylococcus haemolyticus JCSC1435]KDP49515.1 signal peptidase II [Staphylococcus aureus subsp. aureus CO-98]MBN4933977.1 signal peptidase II [Staphylococcus sp. EG-SA-6]MDU2098153.1 signal peptidase II [Staphylococcus sp.]GEU17386.1 lipoprotein signal peptidase [Bacillus anthracis]AKC76509
MKKKYYITISLIVAIAILIIDQVTKRIIATTMNIGDSYEVIPNFLNITSHRNNGAAWGILSGKMGFFYIITIVILIVLVLFYIKEAKYNLFMQVAISLLFAGALGNFIDRLVNGEVVDFVDTNIFGYDFPIFNVADSSLTIGVLFIIIALLKDANSKE